MANSHRFYTYFLIDPRTGLIFYVGKGTGKRMYDHDENSANSYTRERIGEIKSLGLKIVYEQVIKEETDEFCKIMERFFIASIGRESLCNLTKGGDAPPSGENHPCKDPKVRAKISAALMGKPGPWLGKKRDRETIAKLTAANKGRPSWNKGRKGVQVAWNKGSYRASELTFEIQAFENEGGFITDLIDLRRTCPRRSNKGKKFPSISQKMKGNQNSKGKIPWCKGKEWSHEQKRNLFGRIPWNKGKTGYTKRVSESCA
jgi:hypothetical protein